MKTNNKYSAVKKALEDGFKLHGFSSGGRLRVLILKKDGTKQNFYGEGTSFNHALRILTDDVKAGGRAYEDVYGKFEPHYLTGAYPDGTDVDAHLYQGHGLEVEMKDGVVVAKLDKLNIIRTPKEVTESVYKNGLSVKWKQKGRKTVYTSSLGDVYNGKQSCVTNAEQGASDPWSFKTKFNGIGSSLMKAIENGLAGLNKEPEYTIIKKK